MKTRELTSAERRERYGRPVIISWDNHAYLRELAERRDIPMKQIVDELISNQRTWADK